MDEKAKKQILRMIPYGLYVLTARTDEGASVAVVSWLSQASFEPPRLLAGLRKDSGIWQRVRDAGTFAVNFLDGSQKALASDLLRRSEVEAGSVTGHPIHDGPNGAPILDEAPAYLACRVVESLDAGDHTFFLADIIEAEVQAGAPGEKLAALAMTDTHWRYGG